MMRTTVTLDQDIYEAAMYVSRASGRRLGKVLSEMARKGIRAENRLPLRIKKKGRFPVVDLPPDAPIITEASIRKFIDEEGLF